MLSRRWIINYFLIVLIIIFTYIGNKYNVQTGYQEDRSISNIKPAQVQSLSIQTADGSFELRRESDRWFVVDPVTWPANNINIERILSLTETETDSRLAASEIDLNELGLQFPRAVLQIDDTRVRPILEIRRPLHDEAGIGGVLVALVSQGHVGTFELEDRNRE